MTQKLPRLRAREVIRILQQHGFIQVSQRGSHPDTGRQVIVPYHKGKQLPLGTLKSIIEGSSILEEEFHI